MFIWVFCFVFGASYNIVCKEHPLRHPNPEAFLNVYMFVNFLMVRTFLKG